MEPDLDWYQQHVVLASGPECAPVGPVRSAQADWLVAAEALTSQDTFGPAVGRALVQGLVLTRAQARAAGVTAGTARGLVRRGRWSVPRHGVLSPLPTTEDGPSGAGPETAATAAALLWPRTVIGYASAATLHGLPLLHPPGPPALVSGHVQQACSRTDVRLHVAALPADEVESWFGARVTTIERTIVDLARARGAAQGLVAADAALHERLTTPRALRRAVRRQRGWPGVRAARRAVELADGDAESPLESLVRLCLIESGLPTPELQGWVGTATGAFRVDLLYRGARVIIEADGLLKYRAGGFALVEEKRRQEALERAGYRVVRVTWDDIVRHPHATVARVRAALAGR